MEASHYYPADALPPANIGFADPRSSGSGPSAGPDGSDGDVYYDASSQNRTDVLKLVLYDLNSAIAPREMRLMAIHAAMDEFDHDDEVLHDEELDLRADHILLQKLTYAMCIEPSGIEVGYICSCMESVYRAGRTRLAQSFHEICDALLPLFVEMIRPPKGYLEAKARAREEVGLTASFSVKKGAGSTEGSNSNSGVRGSGGPGSAASSGNKDYDLLQKSTKNADQPHAVPEDELSFEPNFTPQTDQPQQPCYGDSESESAESVEIPAPAGEYFDQVNRSMVHGPGGAAAVNQSTKTAPVNSSMINGPGGAGGGAPMAKEEETAPPRHLSLPVGGGDAAVAATAVPDPSESSFDVPAGSSEYFEKRKAAEGAVGPTEAQSEGGSTYFNPMRASHSQGQDPNFNGDQGQQADFQGQQANQDLDVGNNALVVHPVVLEDPNARALVIHQGGSKFGYGQGSAAAASPAPAAEGHHKASSTHGTGATNNDSTNTAAAYEVITPTSDDDANKAVGYEPLMGYQDVTSQVGAASAAVGAAGAAPAPSAQDGVAAAPPAAAQERRRLSAESVIKMELDEAMETMKNEKKQQQQQHQHQQQQQQSPAEGNAPSSPPATSEERQRGRERGRSAKSIIKMELDEAMEAIKKQQQQQQQQQQQSAAAAPAVATKSDSHLPQSAESIIKMELDDAMEAMKIQHQQQQPSAAPGDGLGPPPQRLSLEYDETQAQALEVVRPKTPEQHAMNLRGGGGGGSGASPNSTDDDELEQSDHFEFDASFRPANLRRGDASGSVFSSHSSQTSFDPATFRPSQFTPRFNNLAVSGIAGPLGHGGTAGGGGGMSSDDASDNPFSDASSYRGGAGSSVGGYGGGGGSDSISGMSRGMEEDHRHSASSRRFSDTSSFKHYRKSVGGNSDFTEGGSGRGMGGIDSDESHHFPLGYDHPPQVRAFESSVNTAGEALDGRMYGDGMEEDGGLPTAPNVRASGDSSHAFATVPDTDRGFDDRPPVRAFGDLSHRFEGVSGSDQGYNDPTNGRIFNNPPQDRTFSESPHGFASAPVSDRGLDDSPQDRAFGDSSHGFKGSPRSDPGYDNPSRDRNFDEPPQVRAFGDSLVENEAPQVRAFGDSLIDNDQPNSQDFNDVHDNQGFHDAPHVRAFNESDVRNDQGFNGVREDNQGFNDQPHVQAFEHDFDSNFSNNHGFNDAPSSSQGFNDHHDYMSSTNPDSSTPPRGDQHAPSNNDFNGHNEYMASTNPDPSAASQGAPPEQARASPSAFDEHGGYSGGAPNIFTGYDEDGRTINTMDDNTQSKTIGDYDNESQMPPPSTSGASSYKSGASGFKSKGSLGDSSFFRRDGPAYRVENSEGDMEEMGAMEESVRSNAFDEHGGYSGGAPDVFKGYDDDGRTINTFEMQPPQATPSNDPAHSNSSQQEKETIYSSAQGSVFGGENNSQIGEDYRTHFSQNSGFPGDGQGSTMSGSGFPADGQGSTMSGSGFPADGQGSYMSGTDEWREQNEPPSSGMPENQNNNPLNSNYNFQDLDENDGQFEIDNNGQEEEAKYAGTPFEQGAFDQENNMNSDSNNSNPGGGSKVVQQEEDIFQFKEPQLSQTSHDYFNYSDPVEDGEICPLAVRKVIKVMRYFSRVLSAMEPLAQQSGLVDALLYHMTKKPRSVDYEDEISSRVDAIAVIVNLACAEENKIMLVYHPGLLDAVINIANHDPIDEAREHAAIVLMNLAYAEENKVHMVNQDHLLDTLVHLLSDVSPFTRRYASAALFTLACTYANTAVMARHCDGGILEALRKVLLNDPIDEARVNAAEALFNMARNNSDDTVENMGNHPRLLASLAHSVLTDYSADVRAYSARALEWLSADIHHPMPCHKILLKALTTASQWTKTTCIAEALKMQASLSENRKPMVEHKGLLDALAALSLLEGITDDEVKTCAISALERLSKEASTRHIMVKNEGVMTALTKATFAAEEDDPEEGTPNALLMKTALKNLAEHM